MFRKHYIFWLIFLVFFSFYFLRVPRAEAYGNGFDYSRSVTIDHTKVPNTDLSNFPVLVSGTYSYLATEANGGKVKNASGYDVGFYTNPNCSTGKMNWQTENYNAVTGEVIYWVKVPTVSHSVDTVFYVCYSNQSISTDQSSATSVWDSNYKTVYHFGTNAMSTTDSTSNARTLTNSNVASTTGQIGGAASFNGTNAEFTSPVPKPSLPITFQFWVYTADTTPQGIFDTAPGTGHVLRNVDVNGTIGDNFEFDWWGTPNATTTVSVNTWTKYDVVYSYSSARSLAVYKNGVLNNSGTGINDSTVAWTTFHIGSVNKDYPPVYWYNGKLDEFRISSTARSADWLATEYNNQSSPSTFYSLGTESSADITAPTITSVSSDKIDGSYKAGEIIDIDVTFSEAVTSTGNVTITLETGDTDRTCTFTVSNSSTGTCNYTVQAGDTSSDLTVYLISGTIADQSANPMSNFTPTTNLAANKELVIDTTPPETPLADPEAGTYSSVQSVSLSSASSSAIFYTTNGEDPTTSSTLYSSAISVSESTTIKALAVDEADNQSSVLTAEYVIILDSDDPILSNIRVYTSEEGAIITWNTNENASALINYGLTSSTTESTEETDTSPRDTTHSVTISGLASCARYYYKLESKDSYSNTGYSSTGIFKTTDCTGDSTITATGQETINVESGGEISESNITLVVPTNVSSTTNSLTFQINTLDSEAFFEEAQTPAGYSKLNNNIYSLKALIDASTTVTTFDEPIEITLDYEDSDILGINESTLWIYRYDGSNWHALNNCVVNQTSNTVTCDTTSFSDFGLFGEEVEEEEEPEVTSSRGTGTTVEGRIKNLLAIGKIREAEELQKQYSKPITIDIASTTITNQMATTSKFVFTQTLRPQMIHGEVKELQKFLNQNGYILTLSGLGSPGQESEYFGTLTQLALIKFQEANFDSILKPLNLAKGTGIFGEATRTFVNNLLKQ
jgi:hypothetical protein